MRANFIAFLIAKFISKLEPVALVQRSPMAKIVSLSKTHELPSKSSVDIASLTNNASPHSGLILAL